MNITNNTNIIKVSARVPALLKDMIPGYLHKRRLDVAAMKTAHEKGDFTEIRKTAHSIRGSAGGYGFDGLTEIAAKLENASISQDAAVTGQLILDIEIYISTVEITYE